MAFVVDDDDREHRHAKPDVPGVLSHAGLRHTIETWDLDRQVESLREEVKEALDESRRSKLYCQQVRKELQDLVATELDESRESKVYGDVASLLSNTTTLVEKFAVFETYLREKMELERKQQQAQIIDDACAYAQQQVAELRADVRGTLISFKEEIVALQQSQHRDASAASATLQSVAANAAASLASAVAATQEQTLERIAETRTWVESLVSNLQMSLQAAVRTVALESQNAVERLRSHVEREIGDVSGKILEQVSAVEKQTKDSLHDLQSAHENAKSSLKATVGELRQAVETSASAVADRCQSIQAVTEDTLRRSSIAAEDQTALKLLQLRDFVNSAVKASSEATRSVVDEQCAVTAQLQGELRHLESVFVHVFGREMLLSHRRSSATAKMPDTASISAAASSGVVFRANSFCMSKETPETQELSEADVSELQLYLQQYKRDVLKEVVDVHLSNLNSTMLARHESDRDTTARSMSELRDEVALMKRIHASDASHVAQRIEELESQIRGSHDWSTKQLDQLRGDVDTHHKHVSATADEIRASMTASAARTMTVAEELRKQVEEQQHRIASTLQETHRSHHEHHRAGVTALAQYVRRNAMFLLQRQCAQQQRLHVMHLWRQFTAMKTKNRRRMRSVIAQRATGVLERTVLPQIQMTLRRSMWALWKRFLVCRRHYRRQSRIANSCAVDAHRKVVVGFFKQWMRWASKRLLRRRSSQLLDTTRNRLQARFFAQWIAATMRRRRRLQARRFFSLLSLSACKGVESRSIVATLPFRPHDSKFVSPSKAHPSAAPRDVEVARAYFTMWSRRAEWRRRAQLAATILEQDGVIDTLRLDVRRVFGEVVKLREETVSLKEYIARIWSSRQSPDAGGSLSGISNVSSVRGPSLSNPDALSRVLRAVIDGEVSFLDMLACFVAWVDHVEKSHRHYAKDIRAIQAWMMSIDEEIRRVQKFARPPFK